ncbi:MAG: FKBP-type peptidyl-prolyl cis-trans isomerase [Phaeodactylibacter sp.]|uniref:FKBP-type peptidyl-prolyl cis-trans isomerase n=1 Tax=Phaeodactylibacter sp. TaxID=1940289 RepID=UPI0032EB78BE
MKKLIFLLSAFAVLVSLGCEQQNQFLPEPVEDRSEEDEITIVNYLEENNLLADAERHESGIYYIIEEEGEGSEFPTANSQVLVKYKGYLLDGTVFDETEGEDARQFNLTNTLTGWRVGVPLVKRGGKIQLFIPSNLAYRNTPQEDIPAYSILIFEIELVNFL